MLFLDSFGFWPFSPLRCRKDHRASLNAYEMKRSQPFRDLYCAIFAFFPLTDRTIYAIAHEMERARAPFLAFIVEIEILKATHFLDASTEQQKV